MITFRDIKDAPLPVKEKKERKPRQPKYPLDGIAVGSARAFPVGDGKPNSIRNSVYQAAKTYQKKNPGFAFKVVLKKDEGEVWVYRLADKGSAIDEGFGGAPATSEGWGGGNDPVADEGWGGLGEPAAAEADNGYSLAAAE